MRVKLLLGCIIFALAITLAIGLAIALDFGGKFDVEKFESETTQRIRESFEKDAWTEGIKKDYDLEFISAMILFKVNKIKEEPPTLFTILGTITITVDCKDQNGLSKQVVSIRYVALLVSSDYEVIEFKILSTSKPKVIGYGIES